jgi:hypothetical protein
MEGIANVRGNMVAWLIENWYKVFEVYDIGFYGLVLVLTIFL